jgi:hypothetical protein
MAIQIGKLARFYSAFHHRREPVIYASTIVAGNRLKLYSVLADNPSSAEVLANTTGRPRRIWLSPVRRS